MTKGDRQRGEEWVRTSERGVSTKNCVNKWKIAPRLGCRHNITNRNVVMESDSELRRSPRRSHGASSSASGSADTLSSSVGQPSCATGSFRPRSGDRGRATKKQIRSSTKRGGGGGSSRGPSSNIQDRKNTSSSQGNGQGGSGSSSSRGRKPGSKSTPHSGRGGRGKQRRDDAELLNRGSILHPQVPGTEQSEEVVSHELFGDLSRLDKDVVDAILSTVVSYGNSSGAIEEFDNLVGIDQAKSALGITAMNLLKGNLRQAFILLYGPPGTGKTVIASAFAKLCGAVFLRMSTADFSSKMQGMQEKAVKTLFRLVRQCKKPLVFFIDECDSMLKERQETDDQVIVTMKNEFKVGLSVLEEDPGEAPVIFVGATNYPDQLDTALYRRFHRMLYMPIPKSPEHRAKILRIHLGSLDRIEGRGHTLTDDNIAELANRMSGFSGDDIKKLFRTINDKADKKKLKEFRARGGFSGSSSELSLDPLHVPPVSYRDMCRALRGKKPSAPQSVIDRNLKFMAEHGDEGGYDSSDDDLSDEEDDYSGDVLAELSADGSNEDQANALLFDQVIEEKRQLEETVKTLRTELAALESSKQQDKARFAELESDNVNWKMKKEGADARIAELKSSTEELRAEKEQVVIEAENSKAQQEASNQQDKVRIAELESENIRLIADKRGADERIAGLESANRELSQRAASEGKPVQSLQKLISSGEAFCAAQGVSSDSEPSLHFVASDCNLGGNANSDDDNDYRENNHGAGAWICDFCDTEFDTEGDATRHEEQCEARGSTSSTNDDAPSEEPPTKRRCYSTAGKSSNECSTHINFSHLSSDNAYEEDDAYKDDDNGVAFEHEDCGEEEWGKDSTTEHPPPADASSVGSQENESEYEDDYDEDDSEYEPDGEEDLPSAAVVVSEAASTLDLPASTTDGNAHLKEMHMDEVEDQVELREHDKKGKERGTSDTTSIPLASRSKRKRGSRSGKEESKGPGLVRRSSDSSKSKKSKSSSSFDKSDRKKRKKKRHKRRKSREDSKKKRRKKREKFDSSDSKSKSKKSSSSDHKSGGSKHKSKSKSKKSSDQKNKAS